MTILTFLRGTYATTIAKVLVLLFLLTSLYNFVSFSQSTKNAVDQSFTNTAEVDMYGITDRISDPAKFDEFRQSMGNISKVGAFYDALRDDAPDGVRILSAFDQAIPVADFQGDETFENGYGTEGTTQGPYHDPILNRRVVNVKSMQMNQDTFDFYNLGKNVTRGIDWQTVNYDRGKVPILLGANYDGIYAVGDQLTIDYYSKPTQVTVAGFLPPSSSMFYQGNINFFLDDYMLIPYPESITGASAGYQTFYGILAFAMLNANIAVDRDLPDDQVLGLLETAAGSSGFDQYALLNVPTYLTQFASVRALVQDNLALVVTLELLIAASALVMSAILTRATDRRRQRRVRVFWSLGESRLSLNRRVLMLAMLEYGVLLLTFWGVTQLLPNHDSSARNLCLLLTALLLAVDVAYRRNDLRQTVRHSPRSEP